MQNIITAIFKVESEGYQAITTLRQVPVTDNSAILQMSLVKKVGTGLSICDSFDSGIHSTNDTLIGGLVGSVVGMLGGPIGMLLMGSYGTLAGSLVDAGDSLGSASLIEKVAEKLQDGDMAMIALVDETNEAELDNALAGYKVTVARFDAVVIAEEVEEAQKIQKEMARQTRKQLRDAKKQERKEKREARREKIKSDFAAFRAKFKKNKE